MPSWLGMTARRHSGTSHTARVERTDPKANTSPEDALQQVYSREPRRDRTEGYRKPRTMRRSELEVGMACLLCRSCISLMFRAYLLGASRDPQLFSPPGGSRGRRVWNLGVPPLPSTHAARPRVSARLTSPCTARIAAGRWPSASARARMEACGRQSCSRTRATWLSRLYFRTRTSIPRRLPRLAPAGKGLNRSREKLMS